MSVTIKHLNDDASFLLTFEPLAGRQAEALPAHLHPKPFYVLLDPWITGPSTLLHPKISLTTPRDVACVSSLQQLPEPDLVIVSQNKMDHCNEATLRQLPATGTKTAILAEPSSARLIRSWKYFDKTKVRTIPKWEEPRSGSASHHAVLRIPVPAPPHGAPGEVTVSYIPQRRDVVGIHCAIGITYRPPTLAATDPTRTAIPLAIPPSPLGSPSKAGNRANNSPSTLFPPTPPATPRQHKSHGHLRSMFTRTATPPPPLPSLSTLPSSPAPTTTTTTPTTPTFKVLRPVRSAASLFSRSRAPDTTVPSLPSHINLSTKQTKALSILFSPHGISYPSLHSYVTHHLAKAESALPLTALLHCFDSVENPWWLGGNVLLGAPAGAETASLLGARVWVSAHDGDKEVTGVANGFLRVRRWHKDEVVGQVKFMKGVCGSGGAMDVCEGADRGSEKAGENQNSSGKENRKGAGKGTEVIALAKGEEMVVTG